VLTRHKKAYPQIFLVPNLRNLCNLRIAGCGLRRAHAEDLVGAGVAAQRQPATTAIGMEPALGRRPFGVGAHESPIQITGVGVRDALRRDRDLAVDKLLQRSRAAVWAGDEDVHGFHLSAGRLVQIPPL